jgi:hypothetical protein
LSTTGGNDIYVGVYRGEPDGVMIAPDERRWVKEFVRRVLPFTIYWRLRADSLARNARIAPPHLGDRREVEEFAERTKRNYITNVRRMHALATEHGSAFHVLLQPNALFGEYERPSADLEAVARQEP